MQKQVLAHKDTVINNIKEYFNTCHIQNVVIGLSGGIDSAVALAILIESFGNNHVFPYFINIDSSERDLLDAQAVAKHLNVELTNVNLTNSFNALVNDFKQTKQVALGNIKSRLRSMFLYDQAFTHHALVCGTSNLAELYIGYFTKFGDSANDIIILNGFIKRDIYILAQHYGIPACVINKAPSAGLWENQTDEQEIGLKYQEIDDYLSLKTVSEAAIAKITDLHHKNLHKLSYNYDMNKSTQYMELINGRKNKK